VWRSLKTLQRLGKELGPIFTLEKGGLTFPSPAPGRDAKRKKGVPWLRPERKRGAKRHQWTGARRSFNLGCSWEEGKLAPQGETGGRAIANLLAKKTWTY